MDWLSATVERSDFAAQCFAGVLMRPSFANRSRHRKRKIKNRPNINAAEQTPAMIPIFSPGSKEL